MSHETISFFFNKVFVFPFEENKLLFIHTGLLHFVPELLCTAFDIFGLRITLSILLIFADKCVKHGDEYYFIFTFKWCGRIFGGWTHRASHCCSGVLAVRDPALPAPHHVRGGRPPLQVHGRGKPARDGIQVISSRPVELFKFWAGTVAVLTNKRPLLWLSPLILFRITV